MRTVDWGDTPASRSPRVNGVPILEREGLQDRGTIAALKRRRPGHATATVTIISAWLGVGRHRGTAPPGLPSTSAHAQCSEPVADVTLFRRNKATKIHQHRTENPRRGFSRFEGSTWLNFSNSAFSRKSKVETRKSKVKTPSQTL